MGNDHPWAYLLVNSDKSQAGPHRNTMVVENVDKELDKKEIPRTKVVENVHKEEILRVKTLKKKTELISNFNLIFPIIHIYLLMMMEHFVSEHFLIFLFVLPRLIHYFDLQNFRNLYPFFVSSEIGLYN